MPAQLATRPVFWAPGPPGSACSHRPRHQVGGHQGAHQVTRATVPGTRSTATRSTATRSASPGTRSRHRAPGRADHGHQGAVGGTRHQVGGPRATATRARPGGHRCTIRGARLGRPVARTTGQAWAATRSAGYLVKNPGESRRRRCDTRRKKTRRAAGFGSGETGPDQAGIPAWSASSARAWSARSRARARSRTWCSATMPRPGLVTVTR